jgi:hypothetical protein
VLSLLDGAKLEWRGHFGGAFSKEHPETITLTLGECSLTTTMVHLLKGASNMLKLQRLLKCLVCIGVVTAFLGCAATPQSASTGQFLDDSVITTKVKAAILEEPSLKTLQITVVTFKGEVQLSGFVDSAQSVTKAGEVARSVNGVASVKNDLIVK